MNPAIAPGASRHEADPARTGGRLDHLPVLDALRGVAILVVLVFHAAAFTFDLTQPSAADRLYAFVIGFGWAGVDLFFVLSGFLITRILLRTRDGEGYFRKFYGRRVLRIFPLYYAVVVLYLAAGIAAGSAAARSAAPWLLTYTSNLVESFDPAFVVPMTLGHFWSLAIEEQFYLVWPLVVLLASRRQLAWICGGVVAAALAARLGFVAVGNVTGAYRFTVCRLDALALGAGVALLLTTPALDVARWRRRAGWALGASGSAVLLLALARGKLGADDPVTVPFSVGLLGVLFAAVLVLLLTRQGPPAPAGRAQRLLAIAGTYSYGMYVFHQPILAAFYRGGGVRWLPAIGGHHFPAQVAFAAAFTGATFAVAYASYHLLEKRFLALKRRFEYGR